MGSTRAAHSALSVPAAVAPNRVSIVVPLVPPKQDNVLMLPAKQVEAAGIEPASERLSTDGPTRVSRSEYVNASLRACKRSRPHPLVSTRARRFASRSSPVGADVRPRYPTLTGGRAALRPREPLARSRFCLVAFLRGLVTNHGAHQPPSILRRNQFAPLSFF